MWLDKAGAIESNYNFSILIQKDNQYRTANLVVSGLPVLALTLTETEGITTPSLITLLSVEEDACYEGTCTFRPRGQTSASLPKHGYKVELCDDTLQEVDASLLGLRADDDWILNPLYGDSSKIREKLAYQIWDDIQEYNQTKDLSSNITYVELVLNNIYWGIYGLQEPVDKKQLSMNETDVYYRKTDTNVPVAEDFLAEDGQEYILGFRIKYPKVEDIQAEDWLLLQPYVEAFYYNFGDATVDVSDMDTLTGLVDFDNAIDYEIFLAVIAGDDNIFKNIDYCLRLEGGQYKMHMIPWDLNQSFGDSGLDANAEYQPGRAYSFMVSREFITLYRSDNELVEDALREKWEEYRSTFLSDEYLFGLADSYMEELAASGAMLRDNQKWPESGDSTDMSEIYDYLERHMAYLDEYFAGTEWWRDNAYLRRLEQWDE